MVVSAREAGFHQHCWQLARALWRFCYIRGYFEDIILTHRHGLQAAEAAGDVDALALMNNYLASAYVRTGNKRGALDHLTRSVELSRNSRDVLNPPGTARTSPPSTGGAVTCPSRWSSASSVCGITRCTGISAGPSCCRISAWR